MQAGVKSGTANDATQRAYDATKDLRENLPLGASIEKAGTLEDSEKSTKWLMGPVPAMVVLIMTLLMFQLRSGKDMALTLLTAPLGIIGVTWGMLLFGKAMGFVALLGVLALFGMIIRNSVILIDQIQKHLKEGETPCRRRHPRHGPPHDERLLGPDGRRHRQRIIRRDRVDTARFADHVCGGVPCEERISQGG